MRRGLTSGRHDERRDVTEPIQDHRGPDEDLRARQECALALPIGGADDVGTATIRGVPHGSRDMA